MADPIPGDVVDDDTAQAVQLVWKQQGGNSLPNLVTQKPKWGRGKSPDPLPYAHVEVEFVRSEAAATGKPAPRLDHRRVTLRVWALKDDAAKAQGILVGIFKHGLTLTFPSGAHFIRWWPDGGAVLKQDPTVKDGKDIWVSELVADVESVRLQ